MKPLVRLATLGVSLWLAGCASSSTPVTRYQLPQPAPATVAPADETTPWLVVRPPRLADHLQAGGIVMQLDDVTLHQARHHHWAEALASQLSRGLRDRLAARLPDTRVLRDDTDLPEHDAVTLHVEVDRFQGRHDGRAVAAGRWQLRAPDGGLLAMQAFDTEHRLADDGYPALVRALGQSWDAVADEIAEAMKRLR